jgi:hypothetical protein
MFSAAYLGVQEAKTDWVSCWRVSLVIYTEQIHVKGKVEKDYILVESCLLFYMLIIWAKMPIMLLLLLQDSCL